MSDRMNRSDQIILIAKEKNGAITTADLSEKRILSGNLKTCRRWKIKKHFSNETA